MPLNKETKQNQTSYFLIVIRLKSGLLARLLYIYIYIYIVIHRQICFIISELICVARHTRFLELGLKPGWLKYQSKTLPLSHEENSSSEVNFKRLWITITIVYIHPLNGYWELNSYEEPCIYANGNAITSFARELSPMGVGEHIHIVIHIYIYIYIYDKNKCKHG